MKGRSLLLHHCVRSNRVLVSVMVNPRAIGDFIPAEKKGVLKAMEVIDSLFFRECDGVSAPSEDFLIEHFSGVKHLDEKLIDLTLKKHYCC